MSQEKEEKPNNEEKKDKDDDMIDDDEDEEEPLPPNTKDILYSILSQLKSGLDIRRVIIPCDLLEPRSLLERLADLIYNTPLVLPKINEEKDPEQRLLLVVKWYLSGWIYRPPGVKKPYNPVLGEIFRCNYLYPNGQVMSYFTEQVSHHPPISAIYVENKEAGIWGEGWYAPTSVYNGNSGSSIAEGNLKIHMEKLKENYIITWPDVCFRNILFGGLFMEYNGNPKIVCEKTGLSCHIEFKPKPIWGGTRNVVDCKVKMKKKKKSLYYVKGKWSGKIYVKSKKKKDKNKEKILLVNCQKERDNRAKKCMVPLKDQSENESQVLWLKLTQSILAGNIGAASVAKFSIEDKQREKRKKLEDSGESYKPKFFEHVTDNHGKKYWKFIGHKSPEFLKVATKMDVIQADDEIKKSINLEELENLVKEAEKLKNKKENEKDEKVEEKKDDEKKDEKVEEKK